MWCVMSNSARFLFSKYVVIASTEGEHVGQGGRLQPPPIVYPGLPFPGKSPLWRNRCVLHLASLPQWNNHIRMYQHVLITSLMVYFHVLRSHEFSEDHVKLRYVFYNNFVLSSEKVHILSFDKKLVNPSHFASLYRTC